MKLEVRDERWPIAGAFTISRGSKTEAHVVVATLTDGGHVGRGECVPYARYGETVDQTLAAIAALAPAFDGGMTRERLQSLMAPSAARNALDCALWDLEAKASGTPFLSFFMPEEMVAMARGAGFREVRHVSAAAIAQRYFANRSDGLRPPDNSEELIVATT